MSINSSSISPVIYLLFIFSFTVLFTIAKHAILSPADGSPLPSVARYLRTEPLTATLSQSSLRSAVQTTFKPFYLFFSLYIAITTGLSPSMVNLFQGISNSYCIGLVLFRSPLL